MSTKLTNKHMAAYICYIKRSEMVGTSYTCNTEFFFETLSRAGGTGMADMTTVVLVIEKNSGVACVHSLPKQLP